ncbi:MAG: UDP-N-acetylmuramate--L-alanine ligase [Alphaproteobacteria bacterium]|nr:UDP-N-acetylmuramate--L-alanine ligase [Alphaproteobacteria bacterium]MCL2505600.1 UDP-N-acetylmuramate--L-alanine ligase [Alphaproteobacteria bacterium]
MSLLKKKIDTIKFTPATVGILHFVGIGGIGMSGIAEILHNLGYTVQGSDLSVNANVKRLQEKGINIFIGHDAKNIENANVLVISSAVTKDNLEVVAARKAAIPIIKRAEMLGELMKLKLSIAVGGTHGKTTTTYMVANLLECANLDPTVINGGIINSYATNARLGDGDIMVVESDESDGSFTKLPATIAIVTNIDREHMDHYHDFSSVRKAYRTFIQNIPFYGFAVLCIDHPEVQELMSDIQDMKVISYGFSENAEVRAVNIKQHTKGTSFDVRYSYREGKASEVTARTIKDFDISVFGMHNVQNALAAISIGLRLSIEDEVIKTAVKRFESVKRRFTNVGVVNGVTIIDDYAHHPIEIKATLKAGLQAKGEKGKLIAVMQPHRYTRLSDMFSDFCKAFGDADTVIVADVYSAGEAPIEGANKEALAKGLREQGHKNVIALDSPENLAKIISDVASRDDYVICLGAGSISAWANDLPEQLKKIG